jgi:hypothetical protein
VAERLNKYCFGFVQMNFWITALIAAVAVMVLDMALHGRRGKN